MVLACALLLMLVSPFASATVGVSPTVQIDKVVKLRYKMRANANQTTASGLKIFFTAFTVYTPGGKDFYQIEANLYSMWIEYAEQGCAQWPPQLHGPNHFGQAGLWVSIPDYTQKGLVGIRQLDTATLSMFPRISTGIDNIPGLTKIETISQTNLNGIDLELEFCQGDTFTNELSGWGARIDPANFTNCLAELVGGVVYRKWGLTCKIGGDVFRWEFAVPEDNGRYIAPGRLLNFVTEFFNKGPFYQVFVWDVEVQPENDPNWHPIKKWRMDYRADPNPNLGYGCRLTTYQNRPALEFSNDGIDNYFQLGDVFELPAELSLNEQHALTIRGSVGTRYSVQFTESLPARNWIFLQEVVLLETPKTIILGVPPLTWNGFFRTAITNAVNSLRWIPPGSFMMGSDASEVGRNGDETPHRVTLTNGFWMSRYEITQGEYAALMGTNPSSFPLGLDYPVESLRWDQAANYCARLTIQEQAAGRLPPGYVYRLPTEAEWEYACRATSTTPFHFGSSLTGTLANFDGKRPYPPIPGGDSTGTFRGQTTPVGSYSTNQFGLLDMHGNVFEWCADWYGPYPSGAVTNPAGPATATQRVFRGGGWGDSGAQCRSAIRWAQTPDFISYAIGFRVVLGRP
jgi:formylglycine-generating enzyme